QSGFAGPIYLVNPRYPMIEGLAAFQNFSALPGPPDLAILTVPPPVVPEVVGAAGARGTAAAISLATGLGDGPGSLAAATRRAAAAASLRLVGPNSLGIMVPARQCNASFGLRMPREGDLALLSQSGAI